MPLKSESLLEKDTSANTNGLHKLIRARLLLARRLSSQNTQKIYFILKMVIKRKPQPTQLCIRKHMATSPLVSNVIEATIGNWTEVIMHLVMVNRNYSMELANQSTQSELTMASQRL